MTRISAFALTSLLLAAPVFGASSLRFYANGTGGIDRVEIPIDAPEVPADVGATDFTVEAWLKVAAIDPDANATCATGTDAWINGAIFWDRDIFGTPSYGDFGASVFLDGSIGWGVADGSGGGGVCGCSIDDGQWHHVAATWRESDGQIALYCDGVQASTGAGPTGNATFGVSYEDGTGSGKDPYFVLGAEKHDAGSGFPSFNGWMDELRISTTLRYTGTYTVPTAAFVTDGSTAALYHFDEGTGTTLTDTSGVGPSNGSLQVGGTPSGPYWSADRFYVEPTLVGVTLAGGVSVR